MSDLRDPAAMARFETEEGRREGSGLSAETWRDLESECVKTFWQNVPLTKYLLDMSCKFETVELTKATLEYDAPEKDSPAYNIHSLPLMFAHSDGSNREEAISAACDVGKLVERTLIGIPIGVGASNRSEYYGLTTAKGSLVHKFDKDVATKYNLMSCIQLLYERRFYGKFTLAVPEKKGKEYFGWVSQVEGIFAVVESPALAPNQRILFQPTPDVVRVVVAMRPRLIWWDKQYKFITITVPQIRQDFEGRAGVALLEGYP